MKISYTSWHMMAYKNGGVFTFSNELPILIRQERSLLFVFLAHLSSPIDFYRLVNMSWVTAVKFSLYENEGQFPTISKQETEKYGCCIVMVAGILVHWKDNRINYV